MGTPLKVSDSLFVVAKQEAQATDRSITAQIEHWARIGQAVEAILAHRELLTLKKAGELLSPVFPSLARRREVHDVLMRVAATSDRKKALSAIRASGKPVYATDPAHPGMIVQVSPDGSRKLGRLEGRRFVPADGTARGR